MGTVKSIKSRGQTTRYEVTLTVEVESRVPITDIQVVGEAVANVLTDACPVIHGGLTLADVMGVTETRSIEDVEAG